eukprot:CAMPEP_0116910424 /NCGR_PEP_ID=MMETSP0467-20121206/14871_1 /TAXON_ID=283647 /ORGANISM="Mesodinium pulex, Strain SPMC105" /LENGTH=89 /DNA_ID=CAMNT_0004585987 /DNA_START=1104 /DNA_END=1370 /DNA_ORIENTATION=+
MPGRVQNGETFRIRLEVGFADVYGFAFGAFLFVEIQNLGHPPGLAVGGLRVLLVLLDGALVNLASEQHDAAAHGGLAAVHMPDEHDVGW